MFEKIKKFIQNEIIMNSSVPELKNTDNLIENGIIDSLGIQKLIMFLEKEFKINISDDDLIPDNFETIDSIEKLVVTKK